jgi:hypothetical protein
MPTIHWTRSAMGEPLVLPAMVASSITRTPSTPMTPSTSSNGCATVLHTRLTRSQTPMTSGGGGTNSHPRPVLHRHAHTTYSTKCLKDNTHRHDANSTQTDTSTPGTHHGVIIFNNLPLITTWQPCHHSSAYSSSTSASNAFSFFF